MKIRISLLLAILTISFSMINDNYQERAIYLG
jgi:hypothetical protein